MAEKILLRKEYKKLLLSSLEKTKSEQTSGSIFADRFKQVEGTKIQLELIKIVDCFLDGHGSFNIILVSLKMKSS